MPANDPEWLRDRGHRFFSQGHYLRACECFQAALQQMDRAADSKLFCDLSYGWARSLQARGEHEKALALLRALNVADPRRFIRYRHGIASSTFKSGSYYEALRGFESILKVYGNIRKDYWYYASKFGAACCYARLKQYRQSLGILAELLKDDRANRRLYLNEMEHIRMMLSDEIALRRDVPVTNERFTSEEHPPIPLEGDLQLCRLVSSLLPHFPEIIRPIRTVYVEAAQNNQEALHWMGIPARFIPISQSHRSPSGHVLLYNGDFWRDAPEPALRGNLAHELMHRAWEDAGAERIFFTWTRSTLTYACLERIVDLCVIGKGLAEDLHASRQYIQLQTGQNESIDLSPSEIDDILMLAAKFEMDGSNCDIAKFRIPPRLQLNKL